MGQKALTDKGRPLKRVVISKQDQQNVLDVLRRTVDGSLKRVVISKADQERALQVAKRLGKYDAHSSDACTSVGLLNRLAEESNLPASDFTLGKCSKVTAKKGFSDGKGRGAHLKGSTDEAPPVEEKKVAKLVLKLPPKKRAHIPEANNGDDDSNSSNSQPSLGAAGLESPTPPTKAKCLWKWPAGCFVAKKCDLTRDTTRPRLIYRVYETMLKPYNRVAEGYQLDYMDAEGFKSVQFDSAVEDEFEKVDVRDSEAIIVKLLKESERATAFN